MIRSSPIYVLPMVSANGKLVHASYSLPKWQAVKLTSFKFAPWASKMEGTKVKGKSRGGLGKDHLKFLLKFLFSLNFSCAGNWPFMAGKAKKMCQRRTFLGKRRGSGVRDMAPPLLRNLGAKFSTTSFPHFKTYFTQISLYL